MGSHRRNADTNMHMQFTTSLRLMHEDHILPTYFICNNKLNAHEQIVI